MKTKKILNPMFAKNIGTSLRLIRLYKGESVDSVAYELGYKHSSSYCKLERGEVHELNLEVLFKFCYHFNIKFIIMLMVAEHLDHLNENPVSIINCQGIHLVNNEDKILFDDIINKRQVKPN